MPLKTLAHSVTLKPSVSGTYPLTQSDPFKHPVFTPKNSPHIHPIHSPAVNFIHRLTVLLIHTCTQPHSFISIHCFNIALPPIQSPTVFLAPN